MRITIEMTHKEFEESDFESVEQMRQFMYEDLDSSRDYPGYNIYVIVSDKETN